MKKLLCAIIVVLLIASVVGAMGYMTKGFKDWTFDQLTKKNDVPVDNKTAIAIDGDGNIMYEGEEYSLPSEITFMSYTDEVKTSKLRAVVTPASATSMLVWSIAWGEHGIMNDIQWVADKEVSDYVTMTISEDKGSVELTYKQPFANVIVVRVESMYDSSINARCEVRSNMNPVGISGFLAENYNSNLPLYYSEENYISNNFTITVPYGDKLSFSGDSHYVGTEYCEELVVEVSFDFNAEALKSAFGSGIFVSNKSTLFSRSYVVDFEGSNFMNSFDTGFINGITSSTLPLTNCSNTTILKDYLNYFKAHPDFVIGYLKIIISSNVGDMMEHVISVKLDPKSLEIPTAVEFGQSTIIF